MKRLNNSNFELLEDIIKNLDFNYDPSHNQTLEKLSCYWNDTIGNKISKFSKVLEISDDNILTVICADSFIANELFFEKEKLIKKMNEKVQSMGIKIKDIKFDYKNLEETLSKVQKMCYNRRE